jgi:adenylate cyclase
MERRLAAILSADVVGYSRLMGEDEAGTLDALKAIRKELVAPEIAGHKGRIVKLMGDGLLAEFASVVEAVECAVAIQTSMPNRNAGTPPGREIMLRIGINLGDVIIEGRDIYGDGVNVAARLEGLAEPGGICLSDTVYQNVKAKLDLAFEDLGNRQVKNIAEPVHAYRIALRGQKAPSGTLADRRSQLPDKPSIVVLPFTNLSGDPEQEFFSDGLTEDIISALSAWHYFPVVSRGTSFLFKGQSIDARKAAQELGVRYVLEGSVRKSGNRMRISVQLSDAVADAQVWAEKFDRNLEDIFELQDEITHRVAAVVAPELEKAEARRVLDKTPASFGAWEAVQRGVALLQEFSKDANARARDMFRRAITLDPSYSKAYTGLAYSYHRDIFWSYADDPTACTEHFLDAAKSAVQLDDTDSSAHLVLGYAYTWAAQYDLAEAHERRAVELNPGNAFAHVALGEVIDLSGRPSEATPFIRKGIDLNLRDPRVHTFIGALARVYLNARNYEQAASTARWALERRADYPQANAYLISALGHLGLTDEAHAAFTRCPRILPGFATAYCDPVDIEHFLEGLRKAGVQR